MTIPFFLTRQTANLMEDFARELSSGGALFLLYGEDGIGKTRLLQELCHSRFSEHKIHWLDLGTGDSADGTRLDYSHGIEDLFQKADPGDIIIADHFEEALKKTRHQLFLSWSTDGIDKKLDMIIASSNEGFNELRQLSQQYQVRIQSYQLMPFSSDEVESFLCFCLFPDNPVGKLKIPGPVRKQLAATQGSVGKLIEVIERDGKLVKAPQAAESESIRQGSRIIAAVMVLFLLAVGAGWFFVNLEETQLAEPVASLDSAVSDAGRTPAAAAPPPAETGSESDTGGLQPVTATPAAIATGNRGSDTPAQERVTAVESGAVPEGPEAGAESDALSVPETAAAAPAARDAVAGGVDSAMAEVGAGDTGAQAGVETAVGESGAQAGVETPAGDSGAQSVVETAAGSAAAVEVSAFDASDDEPETAAESGTVADSEAVIADPEPEQIATLSDIETASPPPQSNWDRFAHDLKTSMQWIRQRETGVGTIQILLLSLNSFDADVYYQFVASLARKQVDTDQLRVFKTLTGNKEVYSVFFGEYDNRRAAFRAIEQLPKALRDTSPIPRSVGGIRQEIRRLDAKN